MRLRPLYTACVLAATLAGGLSTAPLQARTAARGDHRHDIVLGLHGGLTVPWLHYTHLAQNYTSQTLWAAPRDMASVPWQAGLRLDFGLGHGLFLGGDFSYQCQGGYVEGNFSSALCRYGFSAQYLTFTLPLTYVFAPNAPVRPYIAAGPSFQAACRGQIQYWQTGGNNPAGGSPGGGTNSQTRIQTSLNTTNCNEFDFSIHAAAGLNFAIPVKKSEILIGLQAGFRLGLVNTYTQKELWGVGSVINQGGQTPEGKRLNRSSAVSLHIALPLNARYYKPNTPCRPSFCHP